MVALLHPELTALTPPPRVDLGRQLRLIEGGSAEATVSPRSGPALLIVICAVIVMAIVVLRVAQGTPPASSWEGLERHAAEQNALAYSAANQGSAGEHMLGQPGQGESLYIVQPGDTLWGLATSLAPDADPRPVVDLLAERNGGSSLQVGQRLVIPAELM
ncbi:MAG: hypothetical protein ACI8TP_000652 [Acidimicrobiales bacterium]|jgi:hypothetical protein